MKTEMKFFDKNDKECLPEKARMAVEHTYDDAGVLIEETIYLATIPELTQQATT